ncbi:MAG: hypothetical protein IKC63_07580 [Clostridia bacterium]|nr:hypothetical protein [Clostridia bacterium]
MKSKILPLFLCFALLLTLFTVDAHAESEDGIFTLADAVILDGEALTVEIPIPLSFTDALGINLNLRLNPHLVESASLVNPAECLENAMYTANQSGDKFKVAIASGMPLSHSGALFSLRLKLKGQAHDTDELCKLLQVKINDRITRQAENRVLIAGVTDKGCYRDNVTVTFNEGTALLNGAPFQSGGTVVSDGDYTLVITDTGGDIRTVTFTIDRTVISVDVAFTDMSFTYHEGVWNDKTHQYENGSWQAPAGGGSLTVTNGSNVPITVHLDYRAKAGFEAIDMRFFKELTSVSEEELAIGEALTVRACPIGTPEGDFSESEMGSIVITIIKKTETVGYHE